VTVDYRVGDVRDRLAEIPDASVDLVTCSPPFLALRSYLPEGHESKHAEIGSEPTPAAFLSTLLGLTEEFRRILTPHGSIAIELGDTFSGSGGAGGDYGAEGMRGGQGKFKGSALKDRKNKVLNADGQRMQQGAGWPLAKSLCGLPSLYAWSLAYGRNLLDPTHEIAPWRIRNMIVWARPNPAVGALGDKYRPATSYITVACVSARRWFDLDAVRTAHATADAVTRPRQRYDAPGRPDGGDAAGNPGSGSNPAGAPPLDHWTDDPTDPADGDLVWKLSTEGSSLAHYAMWPSTLAARLVDSMCPREVCRVCGEPRRRLVVTDNAIAFSDRHDEAERRANASTLNDWKRATGATSAARQTLGWSDCGHDDYRPGIVLDPFAGTGTTLAVADHLGRDAIGIDLDPRNAELYPLRRAEVERKLNPTHVVQLPGQVDLFGATA
jgi:site-specific DNA-methyltransferase (adenine-specific)